VLLQVPSWLLAAIVLMGLGRWIDVPGWAGGVLVVAWIAKDFALYPWLRASYEIDVRDPVEQQLVGADAIVTQALAPRGYVRLRGELWQAEALDGSVESGTTVKVVAAHGLRLVVRKADRGSLQEGAAVSRERRTGHP